MNRRNTQRALGAALAVALAACGGPDRSAVAQRAAESASGSDLCVSSDCGEVIPLVAVPDAENILFAEDGRLFVSGGLNVYEVSKDVDGRFSARAMADAECGFTGLAIRANYLYASCSDSRLFAGRLTAETKLTEIHRFQGMCIPNGTALGPDRRIYVVDEPLNCEQADPKIVALTVDPRDPMKIVRQEVWIQGSGGGLLWLGQDNVLRFPNGLDRAGDTFFGTDGGSVYSVAVGADGSAGEVTPIYFEATAHDDLGVAGEGVLVTDFFGGRIFLLSQAGELLQETDPGSFASPSSVRLGRPPMFQRSDILVTEKGVLGDNDLPIDRLSLFRRKGG